MKSLSKFQNLIYNLGGVLLLLGAVMPLIQPASSFAPYVFCCGTLMFSSMQLLARYDGEDLVVRRLRRQQILGAVLLVFAGVLMFVTHRNEWVVCLTIAAVLQLYTAFRIPSELEKENR
jgi:uncharacterized membrane protein HdeD (DUF308 family)